MRVARQGMVRPDWQAALGRTLLDYLERRSFPVVVLDANCVVRWLNPAARETWSVEPNATIEVDPVRVLPEIDRFEFLSWAAAWREGRGSVGRLLLPAPGGRGVQWVFGQPLLDAAGTLECVVLESVNEAVFGDVIARSARHAGKIIDEVLGALAEHADQAVESLEGRSGFGGLRASVPTLAALSAREWEVASRIARGGRVSQVAEELGIRVGTVRNHLKAVFRKLGVTSQLGLVESFRRWSAERHSPS